MAINKVIAHGQTLIDLTEDTVTAETLKEGVTAHAKNGEVITGTMTGSVDLPELTKPASASDILSGKEAINGDGTKITGTIATKTSSNLTANGATVTVPAGYYASQSTKSVATATQATPTVSIDANGKITASVTQSAGYVSAGTKSGTKQLTTQAAKTVIPTKSSQTAVASGVYTTGAITVGAIPNEYITTTDATATADKIFKDETAYVKGTKVTGTFTIDSEVNTQEDLLTELQTILAGKTAVPQDPVLQEKTVTPTTSSQTVSPDSGYDGLSSVTVNAMPAATQATPSITVSATGLITASSTQMAGYVSAGTKSETKQLTTQAAKTITPSTSSQTAVAKNVYTTGAVTVAAIPSTYVKPTATKAATTYTPTTSNQTIAAGTYCSGVQTIKGDANLVAGNIKSGVSIFGVSGSYEGSGGSGSGGIQYEVVTIPSGVDILNIPYSLPRVTAAYGGISGLESFTTEGAVLGVLNNAFCYIDGMSAGFGGAIYVDTSTSYITYSNGIMSGYLSYTTLNSIDVILINDPSAEAISV